MASLLCDHLAGGQSDAQFFKFPHPFAVNVHTRLLGHSRRIVLENVAHVVE